MGHFKDLSILSRMATPEGAHAGTELIGSLTKRANLTLAQRVIINECAVYAAVRLKNWTWGDAGGIPDFANVQKVMEEIVKLRNRSFFNDATL